MSSAQILLPLVLLVPLGMAALLLAVAHWLPVRIGELAALLTVLAAGIGCVCLARAGLQDSIPLHWFGGWTPSSSGTAGVVLGISLSADPASAAIAGFSALLFLAALAYSWGMFDETHSHFQVLMLLFLGAIVGFCLTEDLFDMFVWFELMSVTAFALTAYPLGKSSLEGALNFTVINAIGSFMMLAGVGLLYARTGTLDMSTMGRAIAHLGADPVVFGGFCLISVALLTKAAIVPFHLWLADANSVAPTPVSVIFSGAMVSVALFALTKLVGRVFGGDAALMPTVHIFLGGLGVTTAVIGGATAWAQRHLKRLLAFSTIAHMGVMLAALGAAGPLGTAGLLLYFMGHGLVKGALFMVAGTLLALRATGDEIVGYRVGRGLRPAGVAMLIGGVLFSGAPVGLLHQADGVIAAADGDPVGQLVMALATAMSGAAILRAALRIFFAASGAPGVELEAPTEREHEQAHRPLWVMLVPCFGLLALTFVPPGPLEHFLLAAAAKLMRPIAVRGASVAPVGLAAAPSLAPSFNMPPWHWIAPLAFAAALLVLALARRRPVSRTARRACYIELQPFRLLRYLHSGLVGDYAVWMVVGLAALVAFVAMGGR